MEQSGVGADQRRGKRKATSGAKLLRRGEKTEPVAQVKGLDMTKEVSFLCKGRKTQADPTCRLRWESGQESGTCVVRLWLGECHIT